MIHEVMVLDHSGPDLALILYASALKLRLFGALVVRVFAAGMALSAGWRRSPLLAAGLVALAAVIGVVESGMARLRMQPRAAAPRGRRRDRRLRPRSSCSGESRMRPVHELLLLLVVLTDFWVLGTARLSSTIRATALQGALLALLPLALHRDVVAAPGRAGAWARSRSRRSCCRGCYRARSARRRCGARSSR